MNFIGTLQKSRFWRVKVFPGQFFVGVFGNPVSTSPVFEHPFLAEPVWSSTQIKGPGADPTGGLLGDQFE